MRRRISLFFLAALMVLPAAAPVRAAKPAPTEPPVASAEPAATPEPTPEATPEPTPEATPDPTEPVESAPPEASPESDPEPEPSDPPAVEPTLSPEATPVADETPATGGDDSHGRPDVAGRYIVLLDEGTDTSATVERMGRQKGIKAERTFDKTIRGFSARLDAKQRKALEADPSVFAVVPDEVIQVAGQITPTGVSRVFTKSNTIAKINGVDERVDADVAIVDTGIQPNHPDLNVVGGYNCSTSNRSAWRDVQNHGTHVAGTVAAKDNTTGVVGVAPGARLWAVKILNDDGYGLLSWYVCGLDWILAQRDPADPSRPLIEAANMSVAKSGEDDPDCGAVGEGHPAPGHLPRGQGRDHGRGRRGQRPDECGALGAGRLQRGDHGLGTGRHRRQARRARRPSLLLVGLVRLGRHVRELQQLRLGRRHHRARQMHLVHEARLDLRLHRRGPRWPRRRSPVRRRCTRPAGRRPRRPRSGKRCSTSATSSWKTSTDPDSYHERLLDVSKLGVLGTFSLSAPTVGVVPETGGAASIPITINRSSTFFERVRLYVSGIPAGWTASLDRASVFGWSAKSALLNVTAPDSVAAGTYEITVKGLNQGRISAVVATVTVGQGPADRARADLGPGEDERRPERQLRTRGHHVARRQ